MYTTLSKEEHIATNCNYANMLNKDRVKCCFCGREILITKSYWGNNPDPLVSKDDFINAARCCDECNSRVTATRITRIALGLKARLYS